MINVMSLTLVFDYPCWNAGVGVVSFVVMENNILFGPFLECERVVRSKALSFLRGFNCDGCNLIVEIGFLENGEPQITELKLFDELLKFMLILCSKKY